MPNGIKIALICVFSLMVISGCAGVQNQVAVNPEQAEKIINMEAGSFKFVPNNIRAYEGDTILFKITSVSEIKHNFTLKDPFGAIIESVDLPPKQTIDVRAVLSRAGKYPFYCDKTLHSTFGMKGEIEVLKK
jgi:plastocyanin